jgi:Ca-activated chloride channel homolog
MSIKTEVARVANGPRSAPSVTVARVYSFFTSFASRHGRASTTAPLAACLVLALLVIGEAGAQQISRSVTFRADARMVLVPLTVADHYGKTILGLHAKDFSIFDDGNLQPIVSFGAEDAPCSAGLVLDISGSMQTSLGIVKQSARDFVKTANPDDEFLLLTASTLPAAGPEFTSDAAALEDKIAFTRSGGLTALIDTLYLGLTRMREAGRPRRALIVLSDGIDNHSRYSRGELLQVALEADVQIYAIIIDHSANTGTGNAIPYRMSMVRKPGDEGANRQGPDLLEELANKTGGLYFHARNDAQAKEGMMKTGEALRNEYVIGYQAPNSGSSGKWHPIRVKTTVPKVTVHARSGYYAP